MTAVFGFSHIFHTFLYWAQNQLQPRELLASDLNSAAVERLMAVDRMVEEELDVVLADIVFNELNIIGEIPPIAVVCSKLKDTASPSFAKLSEFTFI